MPQNSPNAKPAAEEKKEDARVGYQIAVGLWMNESELYWARFNVMLVANSIIIAVLGLIFTSNPNNPCLSSILSMILAALGFLVCLAWLLLTNRGYDYQNYYVLSAREQESYLEKTVKTVSRGDLFAKNKCVEIRIGEKTEKVRMGRFSRMKAKYLSVTIPVLFAIVYIVFLVINAFSFFQPPLGN